MNFDFEISRVDFIIKYMPYQGPTKFKEINPGYFLQIPKSSCWAFLKVCCGKHIRVHVHAQQKLPQAAS